MVRRGAHTLAAPATEIYVQTLRADRARVYLQAF
jgi:hypothetical protein